MNAKFNLSTHEGMANFDQFVAQAIREEISYILGGNPDATPADVADHFKISADNHDQGPAAYWNLKKGQELTSDEAHARRRWEGEAARILAEY